MYFTDDYQQFFKDLAANNHKEWFDENRKRYEESVKRPFLRFTEDLIKAIGPEMPGINPDARKALFRINRDVRFSKDKAPYKLHASAYLSPHGKKDPTFSGFYFQFGPEHLMLGGGLYGPDGPTLLRVRKYIAAQPKAFYALLSKPDFKRAYGGLSGDENKRINDADLMQAAKEHPLLLKKQMYVDAYLPPEEITRKDLLDVLLEYMRIGLPLFRFFAEATTASFDEADF